MKSMLYANNSISIRCDNGALVRVHLTDEYGSHPCMPTLIYRVRHFQGQDDQIKIFGTMSATYKMFASIINNMGANRTEKFNQYCDEHEVYPMIVSSVLKYILGPQWEYILCNAASVEQIFKKAIGNGK